MKPTKILEEFGPIAWRWDYIMGITFIIILTLAFGAPLGS